MKQIMFFLLLSVFAFFYGCSDDNSGSSVTDPFGGGGNQGGGSGNVTFTVALAQDNQQNLYFEFKPSASVIISRIMANCQALNLNDELTDAEIPDDVFSSAQPLYVGPITANLQTGQQWSFNIQGKIGNAQGQSFNVNVNYTVQ